MLMVMMVVVIFVVRRGLLKMMLIMMVMMMVVPVIRGRRARRRIHAVTATAVMGATAAMAGVRFRFWGHHASDAGNRGAWFIHDRRMAEMRIIHHHF